MSKVKNMYDVEKLQDRKSRRMVKEAEKLTTTKINDLRKKSILGIGSGLAVLCLGNAIKQLGLSLTPAEIEALAVSPGAFDALINIFGTTFTGLGIAIGVIAGKKAYERKDELNDLKNKRDEIREMYTKKELTKEEIEELKDMKVQRIR